MKKINKKLLSMLLVICMVFGTPIFIDHGKFSVYAEDTLSKAEALDWAKEPGMGIGKLHEQGYTGKSVNIAYIGQPFGDTDHDELRHIKVHYYQDIAVNNGCEPNAADLPGRAIISNLAGKNIGIAPDAEYYYVANPTARKDQNTDAEALRKIIAINKKLPKDKKFKIVGLGTYWQELNPKKIGYANLKNAIDEAKKEGIEVVFDFDFECAMSKQIGGNRNSVENWDFSDDKLYAPADTTAADCWYGYSSKVGFGNRSQPKEMVIGLMALGWQIAPEFSAKKMRNIMEATAYKYDASDKGGLINPAGFIKEVKRAKKEGKSYSVKKCEKYIYYDNDELLEWGKNPGLGIRELQSEGYTGKNAVVAYIDQPLGNKLHGELSNIDLHYNTDIVDKHGKSKDASMHGPSVLSLIAGKTIGVAPKATIYYYAVPQESLDHKDEADAIRIAIQQNKKLPKDKKIKVIGISDNIAKDPQEQKKNPQELKAAITEAKKAGILVTLCGEYGCLKCENLKDVDDYRNYSIDGTDPHDNDLYVPTYRTTAKLVGGFEKPTLYSNSWASPYVVGLIAMGLQVNPELSASKLISMMKTTARHFDGQKTGGIVNPRAYIQAVEKTVKNSGANDYRVFIFNSEKVTDKELTAIKSYAATLNAKKRVRYIDAANLKNAGEVYGALKHLQEENIGKIIGVQIFGTDTDVPAFKVEEKVQMGSGIHEAETYKSDFFYSNLNNSIENLEGISVYKNFEEKIGIDFLPQWPVARLPITTGDYEAYFKKYNGYKKVAKTKFNSLVSFSSPIFASDNHSDDMGWFIKYRMDNKYHFIKSDKYSLYGNLKGEFPVSMKVKGDFSATNFKKENAAGIKDFMVDSHGQWNNFDRTTFVNEKENRESIINNENINQVLGKNYYNLLAISCSAAQDMNTDNITYKALTGKGINVFAATSGLSMNGMNVKKYYPDIKKNNFSYFYYTYFRNHYKLGKNMTESFYQAQKMYAKAILTNSAHLIGDANYQFNLNNLLIYEHFGLL